MHRCIRALQDAGLTLGEIAAIENNGQFVDLRTMLHRAQATLARRIGADTARLARISARLQQYEQVSHPTLLSDIDIVHDLLNRQYHASIASVVPFAEEARYMQRRYRVLLANGVQWIVYAGPAATIDTAWLHGYGSAAGGDPLQYCLWRRRIPGIA